MNAIQKDPNNIRSGKEWFDMLPKQLQKRWLLYTSKERANFLLSEKITFQKFMYTSFTFINTEEGHNYWEDISKGRFGVLQNKKSILSKIINFFKS